MPLKLTKKCKVYKLKKVEHVGAWTQNIQINAPNLQILSKITEAFKYFLKSTFKHLNR